MKNKQLLIIIIGFLFIAEITCACDQSLSDKHKNCSDCDDDGCKSCLTGFYYNYLEKTCLSSTITYSQDSSYSIQYYLFSNEEIVFYCSGQLVYNQETKNVSCQYCSYQNAYSCNTNLYLDFITGKMITYTTKLDCYSGYNKFTSKKYENEILYYTEMCYYNNYYYCGQYQYQYYDINTNQCVSNPEGSYYCSLQDNGQYELQLQCSCCDYNNNYQYNYKTKQCFKQVCPNECVSGCSQYYDDNTNYQGQQYTQCIVCENGIKYFKNQQCSSVCPQGFSSCNTQVRVYQNNIQQYYIDGNCFQGYYQLRKETQVQCIKCPKCLKDCINNQNIINGNPLNDGELYDPISQKCFNYPVREFNCKLQGSYSQCENCYSPYYRKTVNTNILCVKCPENCPNYQCYTENNEDITYCSSCKSGTYWDVLTQNCVQNPTKCKKMYKQKTMQPVQCSVCSDNKRSITYNCCPPNCSECDYINKTTTCTKCKDSFRFNSLKNNCEDTYSFIQLMKYFANNLSSNDNNNNGNGGQNNGGGSGSGNNTDQGGSNNQDNIKMMLCYENLKQLQTSKIGNAITPQNTENLEQLSFLIEIKFNQNFVLNTDCFSYKIMFENQQITIYNFNNKDIYFNVKHSELEQFGCSTEQKDEKTKYICGVKLQILMGSISQHSHSFSFSVAKDLGSISLQGQIATILSEDDSQSLNDCCENPLNIASTIQLCNKLTCSQQSNKLEYKRMEPIYLQFQIVSPGYKNQKLKLEQVKLNSLIIQAEEFDNETPGIIKLKIQSALAFGSTTISVIVSFQIDNQRRFLLSAKRMLEEDDYKLKLVQQINIVSEEKKVNTSEQSQSSVLIYSMIGVIGFLLVCFSLGIFMCCRLKRKKRSQNKELQDIDPEIMKKTIKENSEQSNTEIQP